MALREVDLLERAVHVAAPVGGLEHALEDPFLESHALSAATLHSALPPLAGDVAALKARIQYVHSLPPPSDWVIPIVTPADLHFDVFSMKPPPDPDESLLASWSDIAMPPALDSVSMISAHWSAIPLGQESFENVPAFYARAQVRERKEQLRHRLDQTGPDGNPLPDLSSDEDEPVILVIRRTLRPPTPPSGILTDPLATSLPPVDPVEPANPPLKPWGERGAWYKSESMPDSRALSSYSRSRSRSLSRRVRPADRKRVRTPSRSHSPVRSASRVSTTRALLELREILLAQQTLTLEFTRRTLALERHAYSHSPSRDGRSVNRGHSHSRAFYGHF